MQFAANPTRSSTSSSRLHSSTLEEAGRGVRGGVAAVHALRGELTGSRVDGGGARQYALRRAVGTVVQVQRVTHDIVRLRVAVDGAPFMFAAGQYALVTFDGCAARPYSMANLPGDPLLEFHVRAVAGGAVSGRVFREVRQGDRVRLQGPFGAAFLREPTGEPILMIAGDVGLAPMKSILLAMLDDAGEEPGPIHVYHSVDEARDLYDADMVTRAGGGCVHYVAIATSPSVEMVCRHGSVHGAIESDFRTLSGFKVYVAGPPSMVAACTSTAIALGARAGDVHAEAFHAALDRKPGREDIS